MRQDGNIVVTAEHVDYPTIDAKINVGVTGVVMTANDVVLRKESNPAIVGKTCVESDAPQVATDIALQASVTAPPGFGARSATMTLDDTTLVGDFTAGASLSKSVTFPDPTIGRDLALGEHKLRVDYVYESLDGTSQIPGSEERPFTVKLKPCLKNKDIMLVYDGSTSIAANNFDDMRDFGVRLIDGMDVSATSANFGLVQFSTGAQLELGLSADPAAIKNAINTMVKIDQGTAIDAGINTAQAALIGGRADAPDVMIILTDGVSNDPSASAAAAAAAKASGTTIIVVGVGSGVNNAELNAIASQPGFVFTTNDYENLIYVLQALLPATP
jgi:uncharacterized protein YegL